MLIHGSCHCGNISFRLAWEPDPAEIPARTCGCTFCMKHGGTWTSNPQGVLDIAIADASSVSSYAFGTRTATFHVCAKCGVVPVVTSELEGRTYAVVSVKAFTNVDPSRIHSAPHSFEGEDVDSRLARRKRSWIGNVRFTQAA